MDAIDQVRSALPPQYQVESEIGRGGSSIVYRAFDVRHGRQVAIKVLTPDAWALATSDRFHREIRIVATLQHPNILPLFDSGEIQGRPYFVMPYVVGETLQARIAREGALSVEEAIDLTLDIADGLAYAHAQGVIHRDIKPGNILLADGHAIIADFGIARAIDPSADTFNTSKGHAPGTPTYMSPEQAGAQEVDARSDIYSLGCVLYEALAGEPPFTGRTVQAVLARHMLQPPPSLTVVRPGLPVAVADAVERTLQKVPADRFQTVDAFVSALKEARESPTSRRFRMLPRGRRRLAWTGVLSVAVLALGWAAARWLLPESPPLEADRIVVYPFVSVGGADSSHVGWNVALAAGTALEHTDPLRWIDGWMWLPEGLRESPAELTPDVAQRIARSRGAGRYITGFIRPAGDSTAVTVLLHRTADNETLGQETAWAHDGDTPDAASLDATVRLLPTLLEPGGEVDLSPLVDRAPAAVALTIQGDRAYRRASYQEAYDFYKRAVAADSLLAMAASRGATAGVWLEQYQGALDLASLAVRHDELLPARHRALVRGISAYLSGSADSAVVELQAALEAQPDWSEAETVLGEVYYHLFPHGARPVLDAERYFRRVAERDTTFAPPLYHLIEIETRASSLPESRKLIDRLARIEGDSARDVRRFETLYTCATEGVDQVPWTELAEEDPAMIVTMGRAFAAGGAYPACAEQAFRVVYDGGPQSWRWASLLGLQSVLLAEGRVAETVQLVDSALAGGMTASYPLYVFDAGISPAFDHGARAAEDVVRRAYGDLYRRLENPVNFWLLGTWFADQGDAAKADALAGALKGLMGGPQARQASLLASALEAHAAEARGDRAGAIQAYEAVTPNAPLWKLIWDLDEPLAPERIRLARDLLAQGDMERALEVASGFDHPMPITYVAYLAPSLAIRLRAAEALGRADLVSSIRARLARLGWRDKDVPLSMTGPLLEGP